MQRDIEGYHFYKHFGGRIKLEDHAYPYKNLGVNVIVPAPQVSKKFDLQSNLKKSVHNLQLPITIAQLQQAKEPDEPCEEVIFKFNFSFKF